MAIVIFETIQIFELCPTFLLKFQLSLKEKNGVILTLKVESLVELKFDPRLRVIGEYLSQIDPHYRVNLTLNIESN